MTGLWGWADKKSGFSSKLCGQDALVWVVPARGTVLSDSQTGLDWTGSSQGNICIVGLFVKRTSGGEHVIVGRDCNECVNKCTAGMREITDKYRENVTNMARDQWRSTLNNNLQKCCKQCVNLEHSWCNRFTAFSSQHNWISQVHTFTVTTCH
jgi:hypothetical protein